MNHFDITSGRTSTTVHAAPGGKSTFSLAHDSGPGQDGMTPRELANIRKAERQAEADRQYRAASDQLENDGRRKLSENTSTNIFGDGSSAHSAKPDLFKLSAPFATASDATSSRPSTRVNAAPGGRQTLVLGSDSPSWENKEDNVGKPKAHVKAREVSDMQKGSQMAHILRSGNVLGDANEKHAPAREISSVFPAQSASLFGESQAKPDTSEMTHKERIAAMKAYRTSNENGGAAAAPSIVKQFTAGRGDGITHTSECSIGDRPSSRVLAPPGGKSNFTLG